MQAQLANNSVHSAIDVVLDTAYQGIDDSSWEKLFTNARKSHLEQFIIDMFTGKHIDNELIEMALASAGKELFPIGRINSLIGGVQHHIEG